jgi:hypothetical protein
MNAKIVSYKGYVAGWLDNSIHDFLQVLSANEPGTKYALITCIDSNPNPASLRSKSPELKPFAKKMDIVGTGLLLPTEVLLESDRIFFGFDEVWFFPTKNIQPKPPTVSIVGPSRLNQPRLKQLGKWMADNSGSLALGGGDGLNFVVRARGLAKFLLGSSIEQPEPAFVSS